MITSSHYNSNYDRKKVMDSIQITAGKGSYSKDITIIDKLDYRYIDVIQNCKVLGIYVWKSGDNLPNLSYKYYGTTTAWWIIARFNGVVDVLNIKPGDNIGIPNLSNLSNLLKKSSNTQEVENNKEKQTYFNA